MEPLQFYDQQSGARIDENEDGVIILQQYRPWHVTSAVPGATVFCEVDGEEYELRRSSDGRLSLPPEQVEKIEDYKGSKAGLLRFRCKESNRSVSAYVTPGSMSDAVFLAIVRRLEALAVFPRGFHQAPVWANRSKDGGQDSFQQLADAFLRFFKTLRTGLSVIEKSPAKDLRLLPTIVRCSNEASSPVNSRIAIARLRNKGKRTAVALHVQESSSTPENAFLAYCIKWAGRVASALEERLCAQRQSFVAILSAHDSTKGNKRFQKWVSGKQMIEEPISAAIFKLKANETKCQEAEIWLGHAASSARFLREQSEYRYPRPTPRLALSLEYGPIYRSYKKLKAQSWGQLSLGPLAEAKELQLKALKPTWSLFQTWILIELYDRLTSEFGFVQDSREPSPMESIVFHGSDAEMSRRNIDLTFTPKNSTEVISLRIEYEPEVRRPRLLDNAQSKLTPDILLTVRYRGVESVFVIDAKYRTYSSKPGLSYQDELAKFGVQSFWGLDILGTATKYVNKIQNCKAAFMLHSDATSGYSFWGGERDTGGRDGNSVLRLGQFCGHKIGAVHVYPGDLQTFDVLLKCFLMYHVRADSFCWRCGQKVVGEANPPYVGTYYHCDCGEFWVVSNCTGTGKHRIVKIGNPTFHKTQPNDAWNCTCPECGDIL